jgi:hypothetical protein
VACVGANAGHTPPACQHVGVDVRWIWVFLDCPQPAGAAWEFWCRATGSTRSSRRGERGEFATLLPAQGDPWLKVQEVRTGGGVHLDLDVPDVDTAVGQAVRLGAREVHRYPEGTVVIMTSPGGFTFCVTAWNGRERTGWRPGPGSDGDVVDQVALDIPPDLYAAEVAFWSHLLGVEPERGSRTEFAVLTLPPPLPLRLLLHRLDEPGDRTTVTGHVDLACADRAATRARHVGLGAIHVGEGARWSVMRGVGTAAYCLTDRDPRTGRLP